MNLTNIYRRLRKPLMRAYCAIAVFIRTRRNTERMRPEFMIIGTQKGGTSSLYYYLRQHPNFLPPLRKEIHWWDGHPDCGLNWYLAHFPSRTTAERHSQNVHGRIVTGEATPCYMFMPHIPRAAASCFPDLRLIILLRDPVARAWSQYNMARMRGLEMGDFDGAIRRQTAEYTPRLKPLIGARQYVARGVYADQLERWFEHFPPEQFLIIQSERMFRQPDKVVAEVTDFVGLPPHVPGPLPPRNQGKNPPMPDSTRQHLTEFFAPHNKRLEDLLGQRFDWQTHGKA